jgi:hypothetical protein
MTMTKPFTFALIAALAIGITSPLLAQSSRSKQDTQAQREVSHNAQQSDEAQYGFNPGNY